MSYYSNRILTDTSYDKIYWRLNETSGTAAAYYQRGSLSAQNLTINGAVSLNQAGPVAGESSFYFDGSNGTHQWMVYNDGSVDAYLEAASSDSPQSFEFWVKTTATSCWLMGIRGGVGGTSIEINSSGELIIYDSDANAVADTNTVINDNSWHHIFVSWDRATNANNVCYIDGTKITAVNGFTVSNNGSNPTYDFSVAAADGYFAALKFTGYLSNIVFYPSQPSESFIQANYTAMYSILVEPDTPNITFTGLSANISAGSDAYMSADAVNVTFAGLAPSLSLGTTITATTANVTFTAPTCLVNPVNISSTSLDGTLQAWHTTPTNTPASGLEYTTDYMEANNGANSTGTRTQQVNITIPDGAIDVQVTINWQYRKHASESNNVFYVQWDGVTQDTYTADGTTDTVTPTAIVKTGLTAGETYALSVVFAENTNTQLFYEYARITSIVLEYTAEASLVNVSPTTPNVTFTGLAASVGVGVSITVSVGTPTTATFTALDASIALNGGIAIGVTPTSVTMAGLAPTITTVRNIDQDVTNIASVSYAGLNPQISLNEVLLTFIFVDVEDVNFTALDAEELTSVDLGSMLFNQEKVFGFKLGNTSSVSTDFVITANSVNNLENMVTFSNDKVSYSNSLTITQVKPNAVTDTIWVKVAITTSAYIDEGTFLINVEQTSA